ncbi:MAG: UDP-N-acetylglucosamine 2-epimerase [Candidatus Peribacteraceae bacterium]|nr:UDP-N-acetylglucosamine 2-epimerase [Candidatus Peribacteraceae bacterium]
MNILFLCGSRGEWGYIQPLIDLCVRRGVRHEICATNMLMLSAYGSLIEEVRSQGYNVTQELFMSLEGSSHFSMAKSLGVLLQSFVDTLHRVRPDWLVIAGDRGEQLMGAIAASYTYTPVAHIQAGELSGNIDGVTRHAIGKFAHLHFAANEDAAERLRKLGEEPFRIHMVGHPALDPIVAGNVTHRQQLGQSYPIGDGGYLLIVLHPTTEDFEHQHLQVQSVIDAVQLVSCPRIWILSNNDAGSTIVRQKIMAARTSSDHIFANLPRADYLGLLQHASCIVGNSSSGLLEAPTFHTPSLNIGRRQHRRVQGANVINCAFEASSISSALERAMSSSFRKGLASSKNPYGDGRSSDRILRVLESTPISDTLLVKRLTY